MHGETATAWEELTRTASAVRAPQPDASVVDLPAPRARRWRAYAAAAGGVALSVLGIVLLVRSPATVAADGGADSTLFALTNQDRASNGVGAVNFNGALQTVGENGGYNCGGGHVNGRALDMMQRNYFSHIIQGCGIYVWPMMQAYGVNYQSAGENIGWVNNGGSGTNAADYVNTAFMGSPDHRDNILNGSYTDLGVGSAPGSGETFCNGTCTGAWMFAEEFAQLSAPPPPPPPPPTHPTATNASPPRNSPAPPAPDQTPVVTPAPTPTPVPTPTPTPTPIPTALLPTGAPAPPTYAYPGLLPSTVESVLTSFLIA